MARIISHSFWYKYTSAIGHMSYIYIGDLLGNIYESNLN